jgi:hypothetical protein
MNIAKQFVSQRERSRKGFLRFIPTVQGGNIASLQHGAWHHGWS